MFNSTRNKNIKLDSASAILKGIADDGGLFVPVEFNNKENIIGTNLRYHQIAKEILKTFFCELEFNDEIEKAYKNFSVDNAANIVKVGDKFVLELFHGPTSAFKDFALQVLPLLMKKSKEKLNHKKRTVILTATSGDTGKAALEGFANCGGMDTGIDIAVIYPSDGVSEIQKKQMQTQEGRNVLVLGIDGNFDDAQKVVKNTFLDNELKQNLNDSNIEFSSANSINIGRLIPQIAYYFFAYNELLRNREISYGEKISFSVPTGNFGDILAGYYAKKMGLPIDKLICASNDNNVLYEFFKTGEYNRNRELIKTNSPSMDIVVSSNLERFIYHTLDNDLKTQKYMKLLDKEGYYKLDEYDFEKIEKSGIIAGYSNKESSYEKIKEVFEKENYLMDTHTAIAWDVATKTDISSKIVVLSTASAYKFSSSVCDALEISYNNDVDSIFKLSEYTKTQIPKQILDILDKEILHSDIISTKDFKSKIINFVNNIDFEIKIPATSANLGSGFDSIGVALDLYSTFKISAKEISLKNNIDDIKFKFVGDDKEFSNKDNLVYKSYLFARKEIESKRVPKEITIYSENNIPISRGLGSSATCVVAGVIMAFEIEKRSYSKKDILNIANKIEGHPDNVAPAIYGGMRTSIQRDGKVYSLNINIHDDLNFCAIVPNYKFSTEVARKALPEKIDFKDAVFNISNVSLLIAALENKEYDLLKFALEDKLHQQYRIPQMEGLSKIFEIAKDTKGVYLSGAGPTVMIIDTNFEKVEKILLDIKREINCNIYNLKIDFEGVKIY